MTLALRGVTGSGHPRVVAGARCSIYVTVKAISCRRLWCRTVLLAVMEFGPRGRYVEQLRTYGDQRALEPSLIRHLFITLQYAMFVFFFI